MAEIPADKGPWAEQTRQRGGAMDARRIKGLILSGLVAMALPWSLHAAG